MRRGEKKGDVGSAAHTEACERVLRCLRLMGFGRGGRRIRIHATTDHGTHWYLTFAVSSLEDPSRDYLYAGIIAEKKTGFVYSIPSYSHQPIDLADMASVRRGCTRFTSTTLDEMEAEARGRHCGPTCRFCESSDILCDGGSCDLVPGSNLVFIKWVHSCRNCAQPHVAWVAEGPTASEWHCPHFDCDMVRPATLRWSE